VVPQKPVLLCGTVAVNLDPFEQHAPESLIHVLQDVGLLDVLQSFIAQQAKQPAHATPHHVHDAESSLTTPLLSAHHQEAREPIQGHESIGMHSRCEHTVLNLQLGVTAVNLSLAQQQLLCLARALLQKPSVMCLDEVGAHLSAKEQSVLESVVSRRLKGVTTLRLTHDRSCLSTLDYIGILSTGFLQFGPAEEMLMHLMHASDLELTDSLKAW
jgi:ABC-type multidrug transport system fused ATPase/permease subunit